jgi:hypothetical protein
VNKSASVVLARIFKIQRIIAKRRKERRND